MERKTKKKLLAILMIITVLAADFFVLSSGIKTYASQLNSETDNANIEFSAYFKQGETRVDSIESSIKAEDVKLYAEIKVKNEGYLNEGTVIELENSNFNLKSEILESNTHIKSIEGNKVNLKQINCEETVEIELGIEPIITDKITTDFLSKTTTVKMIGVYTYSKAEEGQSIRSDKWVCVNYIPDETTNGELSTEIITNKVLSVNGTNQRVVQLLVKSRIANNEYPEKETKLEVSIPNLSENEPQVEVMAINETTKIENMTTENGIVNITLVNGANENNEINWRKNTYNEIVVTYIYEENVETSKLEIGTNAEISVYNSEQTYTGEHIAIIENAEPNNIIIGRNKILTEEMYKGNIYANVGEEYKTETSIIVTNANVSDEITINEGADVFGTSQEEMTANTKYVKTIINLANMLEILGQEGNITITNGEITTVVNKDTEVDENGNVVINHKNSASEISIKTSKPEITGILKINHTKIVTGNGHTRTELQKVATLNTKGTITGTLNEVAILENATETASLELKETITKAELTIENNKQTLSTTEKNEVALGITLVTNGAQYDLYKNSRMVLRFPSAVENVELISIPSKQNADELTVSVGTYNATNKTLSINVQGEQTTYPNSELTQGYIQLKLNVTLNELALAQTDKIVMAYTNENAIQYDGGETYGVAEKEVQISAPSQLIKRYNLSSNDNTSLTETILERVRENQAGQTLDFEISLTNNKDSDINNVKIIGKLPTTENKIAGQDVNTLETTLRGIRAENAKIYYTENANATLDLENESNGWTQNLSSMENAKLYLIQVNSLERGANYTAHLEVEQGTVVGSGISYTQYGVAYDTVSQTGLTESSRKIGLATSVAATLKTEITAQVGQDVLQNGDTVKEGEVIKYTVSVRNNGTQTLENVQLKGEVPEGTVLVLPYRDMELNNPDENGEIITTIVPDAYVYIDGYYEQITDSEKIAEITSRTISNLRPGETASIEYEVGVLEISETTEISNRATLIYEEDEIQSDEITNTIESGDVCVIAKRAVSEDTEIYTGGNMEYIVYVQNTSENTLKNLELEIISDEFTVESVELGNEILFEGNVPEKIDINEILSAKEQENDDLVSLKGTLTFKLYGTIKEKVQNANLLAIVTDENGNIYRGNNVVCEVENLDVTINLTSPQNGQAIKEGDIIEYNITVENTGDVESSTIVESDIFEYLQIEKVTVNEKEVNNSEISILQIMDLGIGEKAEIEVFARVKYIPEIFYGTIINTSVKVSAQGILKNESQKVVHILSSSEGQEEGKYLINGIVWFDENENGQIDGDESYLQDINVKVYDLNAKEYLRDEDGNEVQGVSNENGQYILRNIPTGSYLVIFDYDIEQYALTTAYAQNVNSAINSKATIKSIISDEYITRVAAIEINNLEENQYSMNLGLKTNSGDIPKEEIPGIEEIPDNPNTPDDPADTDDPTNPEEPENPSDSGDSSTPNNPSQTTETQTISGFVWLDKNTNGKKDSEEQYLSGIKVRLYDVSTRDYLKDNNGNIREVTTDSNGKYTIDVEKGSYIVLFEFDIGKYKLTNQDSNIVLRTVAINGQEVTVAITNIVDVQNDISNINIGLRENLKFDLELNKYISKIVVQTSKETKTYEYDSKTIGKVEISKRYIQGANVVLEYTIQIKNAGEVAGYASNIVDYLPSGLTFSSELNSDWYLSGNNLHTKSLENTIINPGEQKEVKLILTKVMTGENVGLINNRAEIYQDYNQYGESDIDSTPNNQAQNEDDYGTTDVIIQIATGGTTVAYILLILVNLVLIVVAIRIMMINEIIKIKTKEERR